ncbi:MAG: 50S ribosomal protein L9 [Opitutales bacterium]|jgi:large subunit ribosomal protein L9
MAHNEILLLQPIEGLGGEGDLVKVRAGYARNYLLPRRMAVPVTQANRRHVESLRAKRAEREAKELAGSRELAEKLKLLTIAFAVKTGEGGKLFGSITQGDLHARLEKEGFPIEKKRVHIAGGHVKSLGKHSAEIKLHPEVTVELAFEVVSENPIEEVKPAAPERKERKPRKTREDKPEGSEPAAVETVLVAEDGEPAAPAHKHKKRVRREQAEPDAADESPAAAE